MKLLLGLVCLFFIACGDNDNCCEGFDCYSFDVRQCDTDLFSSKLSSSKSVEQSEMLMKEWFDENGIKVEQVKLVEDFHEGVCEACDVCPEGDRYFIQIESDSSRVGQFDELRLLSLEATSCEVF